MQLGWVLGGFWEALGRVLGGFGSLLGVVGGSQGCCLLFFECLGASWTLLGAPRAVACCFSRFLYFLYFLRRRRAERRERSERCEAPGLLFAVFRYFLFSLVIFDCFVIVWAVFKSSALALHASTALICLRASRSLLRQVIVIYGLPPLPPTHRGIV